MCPAGDLEPGKQGTKDMPASGPLFLPRNGDSGPLLSLVGQVRVGGLRWTRFDDIVVGEKKMLAG